MGIFQASCGEAYGKVFSDTAPEAWCVLGYEGQKVVAQECGEGGLDDCAAKFDDVQVQYAFVRLERSDDGGDSKRVKFIFLTWVGENAPAMKKGKVNLHKSEVAALFVGTHVELAIYEREELNSLDADVDAKLKKAGGANYDLGNSRSGVKAGASQSYKATSKAFFEAKDKETEVKFVGQKHISKEITACDLTGRPMVAPPTEARKNIVGYDDARSRSNTAGATAEAEASNDASNGADEAAEKVDELKVEDKEEDKTAPAAEEAAEEAKPPAEEAAEEAKPAAEEAADEAKPVAEGQDGKAPAVEA